MSRTPSSPAPAAPSGATVPPLTAPLWLARAGWLLTAASGAGALDGALAGADTLATTLVTVLWWLLVAGSLLALMIPSTIGLTVLRITTPLAPLAAVGTLLAGSATAWGAAMLATGGLTTAVLMSAETGEAMVQGSAYGSERRFPLRAPAALLVPAIVTWTLWAALVVGAVVTLSQTLLLPGIALAAVAVALTVVVVPRFHRLSERWLVLVPAGVVVHDSVVLGETLMVTRPNVRSVSLATVDTEAADLSGPAAGHLLEIVVGDMVLAVFPSSAEHPKGRAIHVQSFLVAPSRPGRALAALTGQGR